jgi:hypothetical protein
MADKLESKSASDIANRNFQAYLRSSESGHQAKYVQAARRQNDFYIGEQWTTEDAQKLAEQKRPALTINMILSTVNVAMGEHEGARAELTFKPRRDTTSDLAHTMTKLVSQILDNNQFAFVENDVLLDGLIEDRGYFDCRMDFSDHIMGEIRITNKDPKTILPDPNGQDYDPETWNEVIETRWMTIDDVAMHYGEAKAKRLRQTEGTGEDTNYGADALVFEENKFGGDSDVHFSENPSADDARDREIKKVRIIDRQYRKMSMVKYFVSNDVGDMRKIPAGWSDRKAKAFAEEQGLSIMKKMEKQVRWTVSSSSILLHDDWSPYRHFTIVPYFPYFRRGRPFGIVKNLMSPQEQLNKVSSQELHIVNTTANSGWIADANSLQNMSTDELEQRGAETGLVLVVKPGANRPEKIAANQVPTGIDKIKHDTLDSIRMISSVNKSMLGMDREDVSGVAKQQNRLSGQTSLRVPFSNLDRSRGMLARVMLSMIQEFYTETRIIQVVNAEDPERSMQEIEINGVSSAGEIINDMTIGEYDIIVSSAPPRDTYEEGQFAEAVALREAGVAVPDDVVIEKSNMENKKEIAARVRKKLGDAPPTPEEQAMMQFQQQMQVQAMQLALREVSGKIQKLASEAELNMSKARDLDGKLTAEGERFSIEMAHEMRKLVAEQEAIIMGYQKDIVLADKHIIGGQQETIFKQQNENFREQLKTKAAGLKQQAKPKGAK